MPRLFLGSDVQQPDVTFYNVVRTTTTAVDGQRLTAAIYGTTIPLTILVAAATITYYFHDALLLIQFRTVYVVAALIVLSILVIAHSFTLEINFTKRFVIALVIAFIIWIAAAVISYYFYDAIAPTKIALNYLLAALLCAMAVMISQAFLWKIEKFNYFIKTSVDIGEKIEDIFTLERDLCLTQRFNEQIIAGNKGDYTFMISVKLVRGAAIIGLITELIAMIRY